MTLLNHNALEMANTLTKSAASMSKPHVTRITQGCSELTTATTGQIRSYWDLQTRLASGGGVEDFNRAQTEFYQRTISNQMKAGIALTSMLFPFATITDIDTVFDMPQFGTNGASDRIELVPRDRQLNKQMPPAIIPGTATSNEATKDLPKPAVDERVTAEAAAA